MCSSAQAVSPESSDYVFAYGSLIWRPGFRFDSVFKARAAGYERRFWQASHDHRGTPQRPGRVVTLVPVEAGACWGLAYRLPEHGREQVLQALDEREKDGYQRCRLTLEDENSSVLQAITWVADSDNPSWRGEEPFSTVVNLIADRSGPSGSNLEYLLNLHQALQQRSIEDAHIEALVEAVQHQLGPNSKVTP